MKRQVNAKDIGGDLKGSKTGAAYIRSIKNNGKQADQLISARTTVADSVELHQMHMEGDVMKMRPVAAIAVRFLFNGCP